MSKEITTITYQGSRFFILCYDTRNLINTNYEGNTTKDEHKEISLPKMLHSSCVVVTTC